MIEYEKMPFKKFPNRCMSMDQFQEYIVRYLQHQYFKTVQDVREILKTCTEDQILSRDDIYTIFSTIFNTPCKADHESTEQYPNTSLPYYHIDKKHKNIQDLYDKYTDSDNINKDYEYRKEGNSEMVNHNVYGSFTKAEENTPEYDVVKKPEHYNYSKIQPKDVIRTWGLNFNLGSAVKYIARAGHKDDIIQDLSKAIQFIQFELEYYKENIINNDYEYEHIAINDVCERMLEYYEYINDKTLEYTSPDVIMEWGLIHKKEPLGCAIDYIHMFHYIGGCDILLTKAINCIQSYIDIVKKERNESNG